MRKWKAWLLYILIFLTNYIVKWPKLRISDDHARSFTTILCQRQFGKPFSSKRGNASLFNQKINFVSGVVFNFKLLDFLGLDVNQLQRVTFYSDKTAHVLGQLILCFQITKQSSRRKCSVNLLLRSIKAVEPPLYKITIWLQKHVLPQVGA